MIESDEADIEGGATTLASEFESDDFVPGKSGLKINFFTSNGNPLVRFKVTDTTPGASEARKQEVTAAYNQAMIEMYLEKFPDLKGKEVIVRIVAEDRTHLGDLRNRARTFFQGSFTSLIDHWAGGIIDIDENLRLVTLTINTEDIEDRPNSFAYAPHSALIWVLNLEQYGQLSPEGGHVRDGNEFVNDVILEVVDEVGANPYEMREVELR